MLLYHKCDGAVLFKAIDQIGRFKKHKKYTSLQLPFFWTFPVLIGLMYGIRDRELKKIKNKKKSKNVTVRSVTCCTKLKLEENSEEYQTLHRKIS